MFTVHKSKSIALAAELAFSLSRTEIERESERAKENAQQIIAEQCEAQSPLMEFPFSFSEKSECVCVRTTGRQAGSFKYAHSLPSCQRECRVEYQDGVGGGLLGSCRMCVSAFNALSF